MSTATQMKVSRSFYMDLELINRIHAYSVRNGVSDSEAFRRLVGAGWDALRLRSHNPKKCAECRSNQE